MRTPTNGLPDPGGGRRPARLDALPHDVSMVLATLDDLDSDPTAEDVLAIVLDHLVDQLDEPRRSAVRMVVLGRMTYEEASDLLYADLGRKVHRKQVWNWVRSGLRQVRAWLEATSNWSSILTEGRIPAPDVVMPGSPPRGEVGMSLDDVLDTEPQED